MPLTNAEKQRRWRERNQCVLSDSAEAIAAKLIQLDSEDRPKLREISRRITKQLRRKHR